MSGEKINRPEQTDQQPPRQVTVQPQEPVPWKGGPPKQPQHPDKAPRPVREGEQDKRTDKDRDGLR
jgi:hypothetical protein